MGEPAGIGPELVTKLWQARKDLKVPPFVYVGAPEALYACDNDTPIAALTDPADAVAAFDHSLPCLPVPLNAPIVTGTPSPANGAAVIRAIDTAVDMALTGKVRAVITSPIHKAALYSAGFTAPGHTEYLARICDMADDASIMMLASSDLRVIPVTTHIALEDVPKVLTADKIIQAGLVAAHALEEGFAIKSPRLAIAGLNPHAGEEGAMGGQEFTHIQPAIWALQDAGITVTGPHSADTLFHAEARKKYDAVLCMYHDQALIPVKTLDFWGGVNITLGLPIIRTSPDHGTALEITGHDIARPDSMLAAIKMADELAKNMAKNKETSEDQTKAEHENGA